MSASRSGEWEPGVALPISCLQAIGAFSYVRADPSNRGGALPPIEAALARGAGTYESIIIFGQRLLPTATSPISAGPTYLDDLPKLAPAHECAGDPRRPGLPFATSAG
jgi:hypothetical protein